MIKQEPKSSMIFVHLGEQSQLDRGDSDRLLGKGTWTFSMADWSSSQNDGSGLRHGL